MKKSLKVKFKVWDTHYDFSEVNKFNYHEVFRTYFKLTTKKMTLMAMLLVITIGFGLISAFGLGAIPPIGGFLTFNLTIWTTFIAFMAFNFFYSFLLLEMTVWLRVAYTADIPGTIAINLNDLTFLIILTLVMQLINYLRFQFQKNYDHKNKMMGYFWSLIIGLIISALITSGFDVLYNYAFMINFYNHYLNLNFPSDSLALLITIFWFNLVQSAFNIILFLALYKPSYILINNYFL